MRHPYRKPDPLIVLALFVGLGVILTTSAQAEPPAAAPVSATANSVQADSGQVLDVWNRFRQSALTLGSVNRLEQIVETPMAHLATGRDVGLGRLGRNGGDLSVSLMDEVPRSERSSELHTGVFFTLQHQW